MTDCRVLIKAPLDKAAALFREYEEIEFSERGDWSLAEVFSGTILFGWEAATWTELAGEYELIYAYYDEDLNAEFIHVKNCCCLRVYQQYDGEIDTDEGEDPETAISKWTDVAGYIDRYMC